MAEHQIALRIDTPMVSAVTLAAALELPRPTGEQIAVIEHPLAPVLVVAGAGAGKTETMASRVIWLVANGLLTPDRVLGLTFTRKAAQQLATRIRSRLARLAAAPIMERLDPDGSIRADIRGSDPEVSTYHAYAGRLLADYGLLLPMEPSATLLSETELWQLAFEVVAQWDGELDTPRTPATVTESVLALHSALAEHLATTDDLLTATDDLERLIATLPPGKGQRANPPKDLTAIADTAAERRTLVPLLRRMAQVMSDRGVLDFGSQMSLAARLVRDHPDVVEAERRAVGAVLLDEYQDTGHAQRVLLSHLFGAAGGRPSAAVTAVGDPIQSIYGWRGASAVNLPRFATDFAGVDGPANRLELLTSWRNPTSALVLANDLSAELRAGSVPVSTLRPRPDAPSGRVAIAVTETVVDERGWVADSIAAEYEAAASRGESPPTTAVLVRRNADAPPLRDALAERGIPAEVVGLGGLLLVPEVADVVATLTLMADPMAGSAAMRLLTGARWRLGAADLAALWRRAKELAAVGSRGASGALTDAGQLAESLDAALPGELVEAAGLGDAVADPGAPGRYSAEGHARITALNRQLDGLRARIGSPLPELVADVERAIGVDVEAQIAARRLRGDATGREHLDAFAAEVARYSERHTPTLSGLLAFLDAASSIEDGLALAPVDVAPDRVQILTVHAAKGLEWEVVAVPHLADGVFPSGRKESSWLGSARELPGPLRGDLARIRGDGYPELPLVGLENRRDLTDAIAGFKEAIDSRRLDEDLRLLYVAVTRTERMLLVSSHHWPDTGKVRGPSDFMTRIAEVARAVPDGMAVDVWAPIPEVPDAEVNPLTLSPVTASWPADPLGDRRAVVEAAAATVAEAMRSPAWAEESLGAVAAADPDVADWIAEADALLAERREAAASRVTVPLPRHMSVSQLVELGKSPEDFARALRRPVPFRPNPLARRGTAFHAWVERRFGASKLLDIDELPGAADAEAAGDADLAELKERFLETPWAARTPIDVEVPFETSVGGRILRGRMDAVFTEADGGFTVVDWKTGAVPTGRDRAAAELQLAAYRVAWAELAGVAIETVRAAFVYVRAGLTLAPAELPDADRLGELLAAAETAGGGGLGDDLQSPSKRPPNRRTH